MLMTSHKKMRTGLVAGALWLVLTAPLTAQALTTDNVPSGEWADRFAMSAENPMVSPCDAKVFQNAAAADPGNGGFSPSAAQVVSVPDPVTMIGLTLVGLISLAVRTRRVRRPVAEVNVAVKV